MPSTKYSSFLFLLFLTAPLFASAARCDKADKSALLAIKAAFNNPPDLSSWTSKTSCCTWNGIDCNATTGRVTSLTIFALNISAPIPSAISKLTALQSLNLAYNRLHGPIPPFVGLLPELTFLRLDGNLLTGTIPSTLTILDLSLVGNRLTGSLPPSFAKANFADVDLRDNQLTGDASFLFGRDKNLNALHLSNNSFKFDLTNVEIPKGLDILVIDHNEIYGSIPAGVAAIKWLQFDVSYNQLCGPIPQGRYTRRFGAKHFDHNKCLCGPPLAPCK
ncbi:Polygalacturonase inhibitor [Rhynchospora pubera]|uniref:Polygalacturonase inhibitor n=1 Tax=Rhynchospora pubera TaxID=906938 RepID=A0AAV8HBP6_9POAL|nr:Polygalacturonase inhibitor [Rhynchospora pubera]